MVTESPVPWDSAFGGLLPSSRMLQLSSCWQLCPDAIAGPAIPFCSCWELRVWGRAQLCQLSATDDAVELGHDSHSSIGEMCKSYTMPLGC